MPPFPTWRLPPETIDLPQDRVHVWRVCLGQASLSARKLECILSEDERKRAKRFHFEKDQNRFIITRGLLRVILGRYLEIEPDQIGFSYGPYGKPALDSVQNELRFSVSHSCGLTLYAVTHHREVGIDVEYIRAEWANISIAERFFSSREVALLRALPASLKSEGFFNCWTRKEAYVKAKGDGLALPLDEFDVSLIPGEPAVLVSALNDPLEAARWSLRELCPAPGYVAALAVEGHAWQAAYWDGSIL
jgi:4'-phosphopantetheinyl transferase